MLNFVGKISPQVAGITMNTTNRFEALDLAKKIKEKYDIPIVIGGPHPTLMPDILLENYKFIDFIIRNEGEYSTLELINALEKRRPLDKVKGLTYKKNNKIISNPPAPPILNLDELPFPEWKYFNLKKYAPQVEYPGEYKKYPIGSIISSRGCPYRCTFCSSSTIWGHKIRFRSPQNVLEEIKMLYNFGIRFFVYNDDNFTSDRQRAIQICKMMIQEGLHEKMGWQCRAEVNLMNEELVSWMKKANCNMIEFGIEDCSEEGIKWFKKSHTMKQAQDAFDLCKKYGIKIKSYFIVGGDHETKQNIQNKKKYIAKLNPDMITASILLAYPGTEIYELGKRKGLWDDFIWLNKCIGEKFHSRAPIYTGPNLTYSDLFSASAEIHYWWGRKKGRYGLKENLGIAIEMLKSRDFSKLFNMFLGVLKQKIKSNE